MKRIEDMTLAEVNAELESSRPMSVSLVEYMARRKQLWRRLDQLMKCSTARPASRPDLPTSAA